MEDQLLALSRKQRELALQNMGEDERVEFVLRGTDSIVALTDRLLLIKSLGNSQVSTFYYQDITGIEVQQFWAINTLIWVNVPGAESRRGLGRSNSTNCMRVGGGLGSRRIRVYQPYLEQLRQMISAAKLETAAQATPVNSTLGAELESLVALREKGMLTDEEFQQAKRKLLE